MVYQIFKIKEKCAQKSYWWQTELTCNLVILWPPQSMLNSRLVT